MTKQLALKVILASLCFNGSAHAGRWIDVFHHHETEAEAKPTNLGTLIDLARGGDASAIREVSLWYLRRNNTVEALEYLDSGIARNDHESLYLKGKAFLDGPAALHNPAAGRELLRQAADKGSSQAMQALAEIALNSGDQERARHYFEMALALDDPRAKAQYALLTSSLCSRIVGHMIEAKHAAEPLPPNETHVSNETRAASEVAHQMALEVHYCLPTNDPRALRLATQAADQKDYFGLIIKGLMFESGFAMRKANSKLGSAYLRRAEQLGKAHALFVISRWIEPPRAEQYLIRAAVAGDPEAMVELARNLVGAGKKDEACDWLHKVVKADPSTASLLIDHQCGEATPGLLATLAQVGNQRSYFTLLHLHQDDLPGAERIFKEAIGKGLESSELYWRMADVYLHNKDLAQASHHYFRAAEESLDRSDCKPCVLKEIGQIPDHELREQVKERLIQHLMGRKHKETVQVVAVRQLSSIEMTAYGVVLTVVGAGLLYVGHRMGFMKGLRKGK